MKHRTIFCVGLFFSVWTYICLAAYMSNSVEYVLDERAFVINGRAFFYAFFVEGDWFGDLWMESRSCYGVNHPKAGLFILGGISRLWDLFNTHININFIDGIIVQRFINSIFSALSVVFAFLFVGLFSKGISKFVVIFLFLINPIFRAVQDSLLPEIHMLFFVMLTLLLLAHMLKDLPACSYLRLFALSVLIGLSVSSRIYGFSVYLTFFLVWLSNLKQADRRNMFFKFLFVSFCSGFVFFATNPSLYKGLFFGLKEMTSYHINALGFEPLGFKFTELRHLFSYPYVLFKVNTFCTGAIYANQDFLGTVDYIFIVLCYFLAVKGLLNCIFTEKYLPVFWFAASHLWLVYPLIVLGYDVIGPKHFLLPMSSILFLVAFSFERANRTI